MSTPRRVRLEAGGAAALAAGLRPELDTAGIAEGVATTIADVRARGDAAVVDATRRFDHAGFTAELLPVPASALAAAADALDEPVAAAIRAAAAQVRELAEATVPTDRRVTMAAGQVIEVRSVPVDAAGVYVPGGRAAYPSSLIMGVVPAQVAGVGRIAVVSPPGPDGRPAAAILATAALLGVDEVYAAGGAAAIAALALGTDTIAPVAVVVGPGSPWVQEAKRQLVGTIGIDGVAGPSEVLVIADDSADPVAMALDLLAQAEHGADSPAVLASADPAVLEAVASALAGLPAAIGPITLVECATMADAVALAEAVAPEHLEIAVRDAAAIASRVSRSGAVFVGPNCATAFGDYIAGSNHVLPTGGAARHASALGPTTFLRRMSVVEMTDEAVAALTPHLVALADAEGFAMHRRSAQAREKAS